MIALAMVVGCELRQHAAQMAFAERHDAIEAFLFDRPDKSFRMCIAVGSPGRSPNHAYARLPEQPSHGTAPLRIPVADQNAPLPRTPSISCVSGRMVWRTMGRSWSDPRDDRGSSVLLGYACSPRRIVRRHATD